MDTFRGTTIFAIHHQGKSAMAGDGQVTFGNQMIMKQQAKKVRRLFRGQVVAGFAGSVADAVTLFEKFEGKLEEFQGNLTRAAVELAKEWRADKVLRRLEAMLIVMDAKQLLLVSGSGEVIEPDDGMLATANLTALWVARDWFRGELCFGSRTGFKASRSQFKCSGDCTGFP